MKTDYERIEKAILYIKENFREQPELNDVARQVYLSPFHFQRLFKDWAGVSPKKFLQYVSLEYAKDLLRRDFTLSDTSLETGLSSTSRLHDLFIRIEGMTPAEFRNGGKELSIHYSYAETPFGDVIIASTQKGICHLSFMSKEVEGIEYLRFFFPEAKLIQKTDLLQQAALKFFTGEWKDLEKVKLHLKATPFQLKVWNALLAIPFGQVSTYHRIAEKIDNPGASRAVGTAIGLNPVAYLIPCHRVIKSNGVTGEYHWGTDRKTAILGWEACHRNNEI